MSKGKRIPLGTKEYNELQRFKAENKSLKKLVARLRRELVKRSSFEDYKDLITKQHQEDLAVHEKRQEKNLQKEWACWDCQEKGDEGYLVIIPIFRRDGAFYYRRCTQLECGRRTKLQKYEEGTKGIKNEIMEKNKKSK